MIYFDNAATTNIKPKCVYKGISYAMKHLCANPGRSSHRSALFSSEAVYDSRERVARLFNAAPDKTVFTYNATYALNMAIKTLVKEKCHLIISDMEHNSVYRVVQRLYRELGVTYSIFDSDNICIESLEGLLQADTKAVITTLSSNVTGKEIDENIISNFAKKHNLQVIFDASQAAGHRRIDLSDLEYYAFCAPGHKALFGIMGAGVAIFNDIKRCGDFLEGGSGVDSLSENMPQYLPEGYEAGTLGVPSVYALGKGCEFVMGTGEEVIEKRLKLLTDLAYDRLSDLKNLKIYGKGSGIISFSVKDIPSFSVAEYLDKRGIAVRGGLHCAPLAHKKLGTIEHGLVRASFSIFNKKCEIDKFYIALKEITKSI